MTSPDQGAHARVVTPAFLRGWPLPEPGSATWWWTRPPYLAALAAALWLVLAAGDRFRRSRAGRRAAEPQALAADAG